MISKRSGSRRLGSAEVPDLDVTPFMNLMIVLVPVLLLSLVFTHTTVIELDFPSGEALAEVNPDNVHLEVRIERDALVIADGRSVIKRLPALQGQQDLVGLQQVMQELKRRMPGKTAITVLCEARTSYQDLVLVMDGVRGQVVAAAGDEEPGFMPLFPDISLGDAPGANS